MASVYDSERLAAAYAFDRPPVHRPILESARLDRRARRALDIGCGAGLSTAALSSLAQQVTGLEPVRTMLTHSRTVAPWARFVVGAAERLPFGSATFDLVTAAGSLNYADRPAALSEIARVLEPGGKLLLYDFSEGRRSAGGGALAEWFAAFEQRFPWPAGWRPLDPRDLPLAPSGLRLLSCADVELRMPTTFDDYLRYTVSGINVDSAITRGGCSAEEARDWCRETLAPVFSTGDVTVLIGGYIATIV